MLTLAQAKLAPGQLPLTHSGSAAWFQCLVSRGPQLFQHLQPQCEKGWAESDSH